MRLYFIRHGQSTNNELADRNGADDLRNIDAPLTDRGREQAESLARYLAADPGGVVPPAYDAKDLLGFGITHLYCSLMDRAIATGRAIANELHLPLRGWEDIHECGGIFEQSAEGTRRGLPGRTRSEFARVYPELLLPESVGESGWWNRPYEETDKRRSRAGRAIGTLKLRHGDTSDRVAMVSHGEFFNWFIGAALGLPDTESFWLYKNNASISGFEFVGDRVIVLYLNRTEHLTADLIT